jgi:hypothetical protein
LARHRPPQIPEKKKEKKKSLRKKKKKKKTPGFEMGGGGRFAYPRWVWSPAGGWWASPAHWRRNTAIAGAAFALCLAPLAVLSCRVERRPITNPEGGEAPLRRICGSENAYDVWRSERARVRAVHTPDEGLARALGIHKQE